MRATASAPMMEYLAYASVAYLVVRLVIALVNYYSARFTGYASLTTFPAISVLVPARNEEQNIALLLKDLVQMDYPYFEVLVYDDDSNDSTAAIIGQFAAADRRVRYIRGEKLPEGWLGKNYACDRLSRAARGQYLLFLDADVRVKPSLLKDAMAFVSGHQLDLFSLFPVQLMVSPGERLTVPLMNRILTGNLPLVLVRRSSMTDFAAANGQFMMFNAGVYRKHSFHQMFRKEKVEDIRIARTMKKLKYKVHTLLSDGQVSCRMYGGYKEGIDGFSKNIHAFFGKNWLILFLYNLLTLAGPFAVWLAMGPAPAIAYTGGLILFVILVSLQSRQPVLANVLLIPFQQITVLLISLLAAYRQLFRQFTWKGRRIG